MIAGWPLLLVATVAAVNAPSSGVNAQSASDGARRVLPAPAHEGGMALAEALARRRSIRELSARPLADAEVGQLLWAAQGVIDGHRTAPSAGALYPLTVWLADARGVWRYVPGEHVLVLHGAGDRRAPLSAAAYGQATVGRAPCAVIVTGRVAITARRYGAAAERFVALEAGHAAQNLLLAATAQGLGAVPVGAFEERAVRRALELPASEQVLYLIPVGAP